MSRAFCKEPQEGRWKTALRMRVWETKMSKSSSTTVKKITDKPCQTLTPTSAQANLATAMCSQWVCGSTLLSMAERHSLHQEHIWEYHSKASQDHSQASHYYYCIIEQCGLVDWVTNGHRAVKCQGQQNPSFSNEGGIDEDLGDTTIKRDLSPQCEIGAWPGLWTQ